MTVRPCTKAEAGIPRLLLGAAVLAFLALAVGAVLWPRLPGDLELALALQGKMPPAALPLLRAVALLGETVIAVPVCLLAGVLVWVAVGRRPAILVLLTLPPDLVNYALKALIGRPRPDPSLLLVDQAAVSTLSFPSGHAVHFMVFFGLLALTLPGWLGLSSMPRRLVVVGCGVLILLAGVGRVALGAHWPSDVLGGYALGLLYLHGLLSLNRRMGG